MEIKVTAAVKTGTEFRNGPKQSFVLHYAEALKLRQFGETEEEAVVNLCKGLVDRQTIVMVERVTTPSTGDSIHPNELDALWESLTDEDRKVLLFGTIGYVEGLLQRFYGDRWRTEFDAHMRMCVPPDKLPPSVPRPVAATV